MSTLRSRIGSLRQRPRMAAYYAVTAFLTAVFTALWLFEGYYVITAWVPAWYDEITPINGVAAGAFMTLMLACAVSSLARPRVLGPARILLIGAAFIGLLLPLSFLLETPLLTVGLWFVALGIVGAFARLHPRRPAVLTVSRSTLAPVLGVAAVALAVAALPLAVELQINQLTLDDAVADRWFYGGLSMYLLATVALITVAAIAPDTRRSTALSAGFLAVMFGLVSVVYPAELHSLGTVWGTALVLWGAVVAVAGGAES